MCDADWKFGRYHGASLDTLREVDLIAAEDTRHSRKLMQHYQITTHMTSYHEHNEKKKSLELVEKLKGGQDDRAHF